MGEMRLASQVVINKGWKSTIAIVRSLICGPLISGLLVSMLVGTILTRPFCFIGGRVYEFHVG
jgi:hypothetical protein